MPPADAEGSALSELQLGIRELFRIVLPGGYALGLLYLLAPVELFKEIRESNVNQILAVFFLGILGYSLRVHERWWPYFTTFDRHRQTLDRAIEHALGRRLAPDHVHLYKYFLETRGASIKDRVHYFSSFYYMLSELSLLSGVAAVLLFCLALTDRHLFSFRSLSTAPRGTATASALLLVALGIQTSLLGGKSVLRSNANDWRRLLILSPSILVGTSLLILIFTRLVCERVTLLTDGLADLRFWLLLVASFSLARLGAKQWTAIIGEQLIFVMEKSVDLRNLSNPPHA